MSRFYNTSKGEFKDFMYKPDFKLMDRVMAKKEGEVDVTIAESQNVVNEYSKVKYMPIEAERKRVEDKKNYYDGKATDITNQILDNVLDASSYMPDVNNLKQELTEDLTTGETSKVVGRYNSFQTMLKENEGLKKTDPTTYNQMLSHYYEQFKEGTTASGDYEFTPEKFVGRPDLFKKELTLMMDKIKARRSSTKAGHYIYENTEVSESRVRQIALNMVMSDPKYKGYMQQQVMIGQGQGFINGSTEDFMSAETDEERAEMLIKPVVLYDNATQSVISEDKYETMTDKEKQSVIPQTNSEYRFSSDLNTLQGIYSFREVGMEADKVSLNQDNIRSREAIAARKEAAATARMEAKFTNDKERDEWQAKQNAILIGLENGDVPAASAALNQDAAITLANNELAGKLPGVNITAAGDLSELMKASRENGIKRRSVNGVMRWETVPGSPANTIIARRREANDKVIESVPDTKGNKLHFLGVKDGVAQNFDVSKKEFYEKHGDRPYNAKSMKITFAQIAKDKGVEVASLESMKRATAKRPSKSNYDHVPINYGNNLEVGDKSYTWAEGFEPDYGRNDRNIESLAKEGFAIIDNYYKDNVSTRSSEVYVYNTVATPESDNIVAQIKSFPLYFDFYDNTGKQITSRKDKEELMENVETDIETTGINRHAQTAFKLADGTIIIPDKSVKASHELVSNLALAGTGESDFIHKNKLEAEAYDLWSTLKNIPSGGSDNSKELKGYIHPKSSKEYRIKQYWSDADLGYRTLVLDKSKDIIIGEPFISEKAALNFLNSL